MIRLFYNYYRDSNLERRKEIDLCFYKNLTNHHINIIVIESQEKLTYNNYIERINQLADDNDISVFCNSDIYLDETILKTQYMKPRDVYALSRWNIDKKGEYSFWNRPDSQDTWIIKGKVGALEGDFALGTPGCDNRIAYEFRKAGHTVSNPGLSIKTYHVHASNVRTYNKSTPSVPPPYLTVDPISL